MIWISEELLPILPIVILVVGAVLSYVVAHLLQRVSHPKWTGVFTFFVMLIALAPLILMLDRETMVYHLFGGETYLKSDNLALLVSILAVSGGALAALFSTRYLERETGLEEFYVLLTLLVCGIVGIGFAGDLFNLFVFFEVMAISSYALVAFEKEKWEPIEASMKYVIMSAAGSIIALLGISYIYLASNTLDLAKIAAQLTQTPYLMVLAISFVIIGFGVKAAMVPLHTWLPDAHAAAPSSISAMLSGIVIEAGLIAMIKTLLTIPVIRFGLVIAIFAVVTMTLGNLLALPQRDLKRMLAYSSIAQMGYILLGFGLGLEYAVSSGFTGGLFHIMNHLFMKGGAFLCAGAILYSIGTRDLEEMRGIGRQIPVVGICFGIFGFALAGVPPLSGFMSELFLYRAGVDVGGWGVIFTIIILLNVIFSLGYYIPAVNKVLFSKELSERSKKARKVPFVMLVPIVAMAGLTIILGVMPKLGLSLVKPVVVDLCTVVGCP